MLAVKLHEEAKKKKSLVFKNQLDTDIPYTDEIRNILLNCGSNNQIIKVVGLATDFYVCLFVQNVLVKKLTGIDGFDPSTGGSCFIFDDIKYINWSLNFNKTFNDRLRFIDSFMYTYLCAAISGELRHTPGKVGGSVTKADQDGLDLYGVTADFSCDQSRSGTQKRFLTVTKAHQTIDFLKLAENVYNNYKWGGSFGGKKWGDIATCGWERATGKLDKISFIDRVFDLKHNGGPIFDKNKAVDNNYLQQFLDVKLEAKSEKDFMAYLNRCSPSVLASLKGAQELGLWKNADVSKLTGTDFISGSFKEIDVGSLEVPHPFKVKKPSPDSVPVPVSLPIKIKYEANLYPDKCSANKHG